MPDVFNLLPLAFDESNPLLCPHKKQRQQTEVKNMRLKLSIPNPMYHKVVKGDNRSFLNVYSDNLNNRTNDPSYLAAPFRICETVILTPYQDLHPSQLMEGHFVTAPLSSHYDKATSVDPSEINGIHGYVFPTGIATEGKPQAGIDTCQEDANPWDRTAGVTIKGSAKDGAMGLFYTPVTPDIQWQIHLRAWARDPINPNVLAEGEH